MWVYLKKQRMLCLLLVVISVLLGFMDVLKGVALQLIIDTSVGELSYSFIFILILIIAFSVCNLLCSFAFWASLYHICTKAVENIKADLIKNIIFYSKERNHVKNMDIVAMMNKDIDIIYDKYFLNIFLCIRLFMGFLLSLIYLVTISVNLTLIILLLGSISILIPNLFIKRSSELKDRYSKKNGIYVNSIKEILYGLDIIWLFGKESLFCKKNMNDNVNYECARKKSMLFDSIIQNVSVCVGFLVLAANVILAGYLSYKGYFTIGTVLAVMQVMNYVLQPLSEGPVFYAEIKSVKPIIEKIKKNLSQSDHEDNKIELSEDVSTINIANLSFRYNDNSRYVLNRINLTFFENSKSIIVGESGCGKSTLLKLLSLIENDYLGQIVINNKVELNELSSTSWRSKLAVVQQDVFLFEESVRFNICLEENISDFELKEIIDKVGLRDLMNTLPQGVNTIVGENGNLISGGERQRIAVARALVKKAQVILIDEVTSSLDKKNTQNIDDILLSIEGSIVITISHKYNRALLSKYNNVIVMDKGNILCAGSYNEIKDTAAFKYLNDLNEIL